MENRWLGGDGYQKRGALCVFLNGWILLVPEIKNISGPTT